ncbi:MAG: CinA family nicotinamide mononucleotide deamidase-related protein [Spirochaetia bacterium]
MSNSQHKSAVILCIGSELTEGTIQDKHAKYLSSFLTKVGLFIRSISFLPDDREIIKKALVDAVTNTDLLITVGGLGPTSDDITTECIASVLGVSLEFHAEHWELLKKRFAGKIAESNRKQAMAPKGFSLLPNSRGTAPGIIGEYKNTVITALPGPPSELKAVAEEELWPYLQKGCGLGIKEKYLLCTSFLIPESHLESTLCGLASPGISWTTRAERMRIVFRIFSESEEDKKRVFYQLQQHYGASCIREGENEPGELLLQACTDKNVTFTTAESCTGGMISTEITAVPGSSQYYWGGFITYADNAKAQLLGVSESTLQTNGAVSKETVEQMAKGALQRSGADFSVAVSGIAGPGGGSTEKPVGTVWIAVGQRNGPGYAAQFHFPGSRALVRRRAASAALIMAEKYILEGKQLDRGVEAYYSFIYS